MGEAGGLGGGPGGWLSRRGRGSDVTLCLLCMGDPWIGAHPLSPFAHPTRTLNPRQLGATDTRLRAARRASSAAPSLRTRRCLRVQPLKYVQRSGRVGDCDSRQTSGAVESQWRSAWLTDLAPAQGQGTFV